MTDPSLGRKKKKITYTTSPQGVEIAETALKRLGFEAKSNFAESQLLGRSTVTKFFNSEPIQLDSFKRICEALKQNWKEIAGLTEEKLPVQTAKNDCISSDTNEEVEQVQTIGRKVTVKDKETKKSKAIILLQGDINSVHNYKFILSILELYSGDTIEIVDIKEGSIRLIVEGSQKDIERLVFHIKTGALKEINGFPIEDIQIVSESSDYDESTELDDKWRLVQEIVSQAVEGRNLRGADLSDADLSNADLSSADLSGADLSGADLSGADLSGADLSGADLSDASLRGAYLSRAKIDDATKLDDNWRLVWEIVNQRTEGQDLSGAHLSGANLSGANLSGANVKNALFGRNLGISEDIKFDLKQRGAIFEDSPGDRSPVMTPH